MNGLDEAWAVALRDVARRLSETGADAGARDDLVGLLRRTAFPGRLALLGGPASGSGVTGDAFVGAAATRAAAVSGVDPGGAEAALRRVLRGEDEPATERGLEDAALAAAAHALATHGIPVEPADVATAVRLLRSGDFYGDLAHTSATVLAVVPALPESLIRDVIALPTRPPRLLGAVFGDVAGLLGGDGVAFVRNVLGDDGSEGPRVLGRTLGVFYELATPRRLAESIRALLSDDNESFRLAMLIYARANGIPLEPKHLDLLRDEVFDSDDPDLAPLLRAAIEQRLAQQDQGAVLETLRGLSRRAGR